MSRGQGAGGKGRGRGGLKSSGRRRRCAGPRIHDLGGQGARGRGWRAHTFCGVPGGSRAQALQPPPPTRRNRQPSTVTPQPPANRQPPGDHHPRVLPGPQRAVVRAAHRRLRPRQARRRCGVCQGGAVRRGGRGKGGSGGGRERARRGWNGVFKVHKARGWSLRMCLCRARCPPAASTIQARRRCGVC